MSAVLTTSTNTISHILESAGQVLTQELTWIGDVAEAITSNPLLLIGFAMFIGGTAIAFIQRLR